jgi:nicotinamide-nucleotide adenylyltransferase
MDEVKFALRASQERQEPDRAGQSPRPTVKSKNSGPQSPVVRALVVGRFQPFHNGHKALVKKAIEDCVDVAVGIGSSNAKPSLRNPFTFDERRQMVEAVFGGQVRVVALPDIHDPPRWAAHVMGITGPVDKVYGNDPESTNLFEAAGVPVVSPGLVDREHNEARTLRVLMAEGDPSWRRHVPPEVARLLDAWQAPKRLLTMERLA